MKLYYTLVLVFSFFAFTFAQETEIKEIQFPEFEECDQDDQIGKSCFENTFKSKFKAYYNETEIATDYKYEREVEGSFVVNRRGELKVEGFNSTESPIFVALERAINKFSKMTSIEDEKGRTIDFNFQVKFKLSRTKRYNESALSLEIEFVYPNQEDKNS